MCWIWFTIWMGTYTTEPRVVVTIKKLVWSCVLQCGVRGSCNQSMLDQIRLWTDIDRNCNTFFAIFKLAFWACFIWPIRVIGQRSRPKWGWCACKNLGHPLPNSPKMAKNKQALWLTASSTGHLCNEDVFSRFIETNCVRWIQVHFSFEYKLQWFGWFCASQIVTKIGGNVFLVLDAVSLCRCQSNTSKITRIYYRDEEEHIYPSLPWLTQSTEWCNFI